MEVRLTGGFLNDRLCFDVFSSSSSLVNAVVMREAQAVGWREPPEAALWILTRLRTTLLFCIIVTFPAPASASRKCGSSFVTNTVPTCMPIIVSMIHSPICTKHSDMGKE